MIIKYKENLPKHYFNRTPAPSLPLTKSKYLHDHFATYQLSGIYEKKCKNRLALGIKTFAITFFSFGFALFSERLRENWKSVLTGTRKIVLYLENKEPLSIIKKIKAVSSPLKDAPKPEEAKAPAPPLNDVPPPKQIKVSPLLNNATKTEHFPPLNDVPPAVVEPPKPSLENWEKQQLDELVNLFEKGELKIECLTQAKYSSLREHYRTKYKDKSEQEIKKGIVDDICRCFPQYLPQEMGSQFKKFSDIVEKIQLAFPEISFATIQSGKHYEYPFLPTIFLIQKALEVLNSEIDDEQKQKSYDDLMLSIGRFIFGKMDSKVEHAFFLACLANLVKTETLPLLLTSPYNEQSLVQFLTEILNSNDKDKIQIVFRKYIDGPSFYGKGSMKRFKKEKIFIQPSFHFLSILSLINSSEKLEWILEVLPQNDVKRVFIKFLRDGIITFENYLPKKYLVGLSSNEVEETLIRLGY